ncbi:Non-reducing polyketide synthase [Sphaerulina musiva]
MAKLLTSAGEMVSTLILIDSPCRLLYEALPVQVVEELTKKGLMGASSSSQQKKAAPEWLVQHFTSTVLSVQRYQPVAMRESRVPGNVYCIWVEEGLVETSVEESGLDVDVNVRVTRFLLEGRRGKKLESEGWERLLPGAEFGFEYMTGNHFQITQVPHSHSLGLILRRILNQ